MGARQGCRGGAGERSKGSQAGAGSAQGQERFYAVEVAGAGQASVARDSRLLQEGLEPPAFCGGMGCLDRPFPGRKAGLGLVLGLGSRSSLTNWEYSCNGGARTQCQERYYAVEEAGVV